MIKPLRKNVLIKLPDWQKDYVRKTQSGLFIPHLADKIQHDSSCGEVIAVGDNCSICQVGDTVFFDYYTIHLAIRNTGRDKTQHEATQQQSSGVPVFMIDNTSDVKELHDFPELGFGQFIIMPEQRVVQHVVAKNSIEEKTFGCYETEIPQHLGIIAIIRNGEVITCNSYHLIKKAYEAKNDNGALIIQGSSLYAPEVVKEEQRKRKYEVLFSPVDSPYQKGDIIFCEPNIEIPLESAYNYPQFPENTFYVEQFSILGKFNEQSLAA